jgi:hypothetical protein
MEVGTGDDDGGRIMEAAAFVKIADSGQGKRILFFACGIGVIILAGLL